MTDLNTPSILTQDWWVEHPAGRIYACSWTPSTVRPAATPLVLFHDSLGCVELWRDFPADLSAASGRQVIAYDRLGFGKSDPRSARPSLDFIADEAETYFPAVREQLGIDRFIAFGHSVGGAMAIHCAGALAAHCDALITESAQVFPEELTLRSIAEAKEQFRDETQIARLAKYHGDKAAWVLDAWTENWLDPEFASWSLETALPRVSSPVMAIHGDQDEYGSTCHAQIIGKLSNGRAQVEILPDTRHVPHRERPTVVLELVSRFVASLD